MTKTLLNIILKKFVLFSIIFQSVSSFSQAWEVPNDKMNKVSPFKFTEDTKKKGAIIFQKNCISCHGTPGKNNFMNLSPPPGDPATDKFQKQTDGSLFFKITTGRSPMPSFKDVLSEEQKWDVIAYFRSFNSKYIQPEPAIQLKGKFSGMTLKVNANYFADNKLILVSVAGFQGEKALPMEGIEVELFAKRYFGNLPIDEPKLTNKKGEASFEYTDKLPGDTAGNINFVIKINAEELADFKKDTMLLAGLPMNTKSLTDTRAMWSVRSKAPIWLMATYSLVVFIVWGFLIFIIWQLFKIKKHGLINNRKIE
jgi:mono/diheme cytochrome c family protein